MLPDLLGDDAEQVQGIGVLGLHGQHLPVQRFRLGQPACLMVRYRALKDLIEKS